MACHWVSVWETCSSCREAASARVLLLCRDIVEHLRGQTVVCAVGIVACGSFAGNGDGAPVGGGGGGLGNLGGVGATGAGAATDGGGAIGAQGGGAGAGGSAPSCAPGLPAAFSAAPNSLSLPVARCGVNFDAVGKASGALKYTVMDLATTAGLPDLVVHQDDCDPALGHSRWDVYAGAVTGLAPTPFPFALPAPRCGVAFDRPARSSGAMKYSLLDVTGDRVVDLVVHKDDCDSSLGATHWEVYVAGPAGFALAPVVFTLPAARCGMAWDKPGSPTGALEYSLMDLSGDGLADLVVHQDDCDGAIGYGRWDVYPASVAGFAPKPVAYALPAARCAVSWDKPARNTGAVAYALFDMSGDGRSNLVVLRDDCDDAIGYGRWDVYPGTAKGFAAGPSPYTLPAVRCGVPWDAASRDFGAVHYSLLDISCDGLPDLVVTRDACDAVIGQSHWDVHAGAGTGLAQSPAALAVPAPRCGASFDSHGKSIGALHFTLMAWSPTDHPSLLVTHDTCDATLGAAHWDYYPAQ